MEQNKLPHVVSQQQAVVERLQRTELGIVNPVGDESVAVITRLSPTETANTYVGNILRRTCMVVGENACKAVCVLRDTGESPADYDKECADGNLSDALIDLGLERQKVLMVAVTGNEVGFGDKISAYKEDGRLTNNPDGWRELPGFNAFFARPEVDEDIRSIGSRLADCGHLEFEFADSEGNTVIGFEHATRPNMYGDSKFAFEAVDGQPVSYTHHVMARVIEHYGADPASMKLRLSSSIRPENFVKRFKTEEQLEEHIPGWQAAGFVSNLSNPRWRPGTPTVNAAGEPNLWHADARGMILRDVQEAMRELGVPVGNFESDDMLDPADTAGEYSSYENRGRFGDSRDLYMVAHCTAFNT